MSASKHLSVSPHAILNRSIGSVKWRKPVSRFSIIHCRALGTDHRRRGTSCQVDDHLPVKWCGNPIFQWEIIFRTGTLFAAYCSAIATMAEQPLESSSRSELPIILRSVGVPRMECDSLCQARPQLRQLDLSRCFLAVDEMNVTGPRARRKRKEPPSIPLRNAAGSPESNETDLE